jgi:hypothetical protein
MTIRQRTGSFKTKTNMNGYRSIYDSYQLANSNAIPLYQGSAAPEALQIGQYEQGLYDTAQSGAFNVGANTDNVQSLDKDNALASELRQRVQQKLGEFSTRGDYENMLPAVQQLSSEFYNRAKELAAPIQQYQEWNKKLDSKDYNLSPEQKNALRGMSMADYAGLKKDASGRYVGGFNGRDIAANVDTVKWTNDTLKDIAIQKGGKEWYMGTNGDFIIKNGSKSEVLTAATIRGVLRNAAAMDVGLQAHITQMGDIGSYMASRMDPSKLSGSGKAAVQKYIDQGYSASDAMKMVGKSMQEDNIMNSILNYGVGKYQQNNQWSTMDLSTNQFALEKFKADKLKDGEDRFQVQGPDAAVLPDDADYSKASANLNKWSSQSSTFNKQLSNIDTKLKSDNLDPNVRTQLETQKSDLLEQMHGVNMSLSRTQGMMETAKNKTAITMGYTGGYEEFKNAAANKIKSSIADILRGKKVVTSSGASLDANDIAEAIADGRASASKVYLPSVGGVQNAVNTGLDITTKDGKRIHISQKTMGDRLANTMDDLMRKDNNRISEFNDNLSKNYADNIKNSPVSSNYLSLTEDERKQLTSTLSGARGGIKFTIPGDNLNEVPEKEAKNNLAKFDVKDVLINPTDGTTTLSVQGYDKDGKETQLYEAHLSNSNVGMIIGKKLAQANNHGLAPDAARAAESMQPGSGASILKTAPSGVPQYLGEMDGEKVYYVRDGARFKLINEKGGAIPTGRTDKNGKPILVNGEPEKYDVKDIGTAGTWIDYFKTQQ